MPPPWPPPIASPPVFSAISQRVIVSTPAGLLALEMAIPPPPKVPVLWITAESVIDTLPPRLRMPPPWPKPPVRPPLIVTPLIVRLPVCVMLKTRSMPTPSADGRASMIVTSWPAPTTVIALFTTRLPLVPSPAALSPRGVRGIESR